MDDRRLSTADVLAMGIIDKPIPVTDIPKDRERVSGSSDMGAYVGDEAVAAAIEAGSLVTSPNYYGIPYAWKAGSGKYCGRLLQYRAVTASETFATIDDVVGWFGDTYHRTDG